MKKLLLLITIACAALFASLPQASAQSLFADHPRTGTVVINGHTYPEPLYVQDADQLVLYFRANNVAPINAALAGTGYVPVLVGGKPVVNVFLYDYKQGDLGPYKELIVSFLVAPGSTSPQLPYVNNASVFVAGLNPTFTNFAYKLILTGTAQDAIDYGKVVYGLDKYPGILTYANLNVNGNVVRTEAVTEGFLFAAGTALTTDSPAGMNTFFGQLATLFGGNVPQFPSVLQFTSVTNDVLHPGQLKANNYYSTAPVTFFNVLDPTKDFFVPGVSPIGLFLGSLGLTPVMSIHAPNLQLVVELAE